MPMLTSRRVLLAKVETEYGTDPTPTAAANAIEVMNLSVKESGDIKDRDVVRADLSPMAGVLGKRGVDITFEVDLKGSGTAGTAGKIGDLLKACGFIELDAASSVVYSPTSIPASMGSLTFYVYNLGDANAVLRKISGARGTFNVVCKAGEFGKVEFTFRGNYAAPSDVANPTGMVYEATKPPLVESATLTVGGTALVASELDVAMGNELIDRDDVNSPNGMKGVEISGRKPTGKVVPEAVNLATKNWHTIWTGNTESAINITIGATAGNIVNVIIPKAQIESISETDQNNIIYNDLPFRCNGSSGNDEVTFCFK